MAYTSPANPNDENNPRYQPPSDQNSQDLFNQMNQLNSMLKSGTISQAQVQQNLPNNTHLENGYVVPNDPSLMPLYLEAAAIAAPFVYEGLISAFPGSTAVTATTTTAGDVGAADAAATAALDTSVAAPATVGATDVAGGTGASVLADTGSGVPFTTSGVGTVNGVPVAGGAGGGMSNGAWLRLAGNALGATSQASNNQTQQGNQNALLLDRILADRDSTAATSAAQTNAQNLARAKFGEAQQGQGMRDFLRNGYLLNPNRPTNLPGGGVSPDQIPTLKAQEAQGRTASLTQPTLPPMVSYTPTPLPAPGSSPALSNPSLWAQIAGYASPFITAAGKYYGG